MLDPHPPLWLTISHRASYFLILLTTCVSFLSLVVPRLIENGVRLKDGPRPKTRKGLLSKTLLEHIDTDLAAHGEPVDLPGFWHKVRLRRWLILLLSIVDLGVQALILHSRLTASNFTTWSVVRCVGEISTGVYLVILSIALVQSSLVETHASLLTHICTISTVYFVHWYFGTFGQYLAIYTPTYIHWTEYAAFAMAGILIVASGTVSMGPDLHQDMTQLYNQSVTKQLLDDGYDPTDTSQPNVAQEVSASILGRLLFTYVYPLLRKARTMEQLDVADLPAAHAWSRCQNIVHSSVQVNDRNGLLNDRGPLFALFFTVWWPQRWAVLQVVIILFAHLPLYYLPHFAVQNILFILEEGLSRRSAIAFAGLYMLARIAQVAILMQMYNLSSSYTNPRIRSTASYLLYQKLLTRNTFAMPRETGVGKNKAVHNKADILNLCSSDTDSLSWVGWSVTDILSGFAQLALGCGYLLTLLGHSGLVGLSTLLFTFMPAYFLTRLEFTLFEKELQVKDEKVSLLQETIQAISMIKMMATERYWYGRVSSVRDREYAILIRARLVGAISGFLYGLAPTLVVIVAFAHYTLVAKRTLTASVAFTAIAVFDELRPTLSELPRMISHLLKEGLAAKRIGLFLRTPDLDYLQEHATDGMSVPSFDRVFIHGSVTWDVPPLNVEGSLATVGEETATKSIFQLSDLHIDFPTGHLSLIAGRFGSGKTLLLLSLLGETRFLEGKISYLASELVDPKGAATPDWSLKKGGVAYVPQTAWLQSLSIRDNILFGLPMDIERYRTVIHAVGLLPDLAVLEDGDRTEIGERGKVLSGGQKARVSLARAIYSRASILLLDDVISAVDAHTANHIIEHCFKGPMIAGRTVIIASHAVEALAPLADLAVFLEDGTAAWSGSGSELLNSDYMSHLRTDTATAAPGRVVTPLEGSQEDGTTEAKDTFEVVDAVPKTPRQLILEEQRVQRYIPLNRWSELKEFNGTHLFWTMLTTLLVLSTLGPVAERRVLEQWTMLGTSDDGSASMMSWVILYSSLSVGTKLVVAVYRYLRFTGAVRAARMIHSQMLEAVLRTKMIFFTQTRAGSIVQRFGKDLDDVLEASDLIGTIIEYLLAVLLNIILVTVRGGWQFGVICLAVLLVLTKPGNLYRTYAGQIRRLHAVIPGPINAIFGETIAGSAVIRAHGLQSVFMNALLRELNMKIVCTHWMFWIERWKTLCMRLADLVITATTLTLILSRQHISGGEAGFLLVFAGDISVLLSYVVSQYGEFERKGVALERTAEYRQLPREDDRVSNSMAAPVLAPDDGDHGLRVPGWPVSGDISVRDLKVRYAPGMPDILHGVSFDVQGGQRIGIVGATGGGKSTLAKAFFSFVEKTGGVIEIDGKDIADLPLGQVRSNLGIIAQDPILLSGTLRLNLDLEGKYDDQVLYDGLRQVQLITSADDVGTPSGASSDSGATAVEPSTPSGPVAPKNLFTNLDSEFKSGGENLSAGQKQLVVLARALLKKHKVLILDEATASIDSATDAEISRVVHEQFEGVTVLIIAHRLRTIMPCSKILVMDKGNLVQQGSPAELIKQDGSKFQELCKAAGNDEYQHLLSLAESARAELN